MDEEGWNDHTDNWRTGGCKGSICNNGPELRGQEERFLEGGKEKNTSQRPQLAANL